MARPDPARMFRGPEGKSGVWQSGATLFGWSIILILVRWIFGWEFISVDLILLLAVLGLVLSLPYGIGWAQGRIRSDERGVTPVQIAMQPAGGPDSYHLTATMPRAGGRFGPKPPDPTRSGYTGWWIFIKMPMVLGDFALSGLWAIFAVRRLGRGPRVQTGPAPAEPDFEGPYDIEF